MTTRTRFLITLIWSLFVFFIIYLAGFLISYQPHFPYYEPLLASDMPSFFWKLSSFDGVHFLQIIKEGYKSADLIQAFFPGFPVLVMSVNFIISNTVLKILLFYQSFLEIFIDTLWHQPPTASVLTNITIIIENFLIQKSLTIKTLTSHLQNPLNLSVISSIIINVVLVFMIIKKIRDLADQTALKNPNYLVFVYLLFPTSFFFLATYSEALFLFLCLWFFDALQKNKFVKSAFIAGLASATRLVGVFLLASLLVKIFSDKIKLSFEKLLQLAGVIFLSLSGILIYMNYLWLNFQDPLYFISVQKSFNTGRDSLFVFPIQSIYRGIKTVLFTPLDLRWITSFQELFFSLLFLIILVIITYQFLSKYRKKALTFPASWIIFGWLAYLLPTLTGTLASMPRYLLVVFVVFIYIARYLEKASENNKKWLVWLYFLISCSLLILNIIMFAQGRWVA